MTRTSAPKKLKQYECGRFHFTDNANRDYYDRHLVFDHVVCVENASQRERFEAVARSLRDLLTQRWLLTQQTHDRENPKRVYYLSMEFLIGRTLVNNIINLGVEQFVPDDLQSDPRQDWKEVIETEPDAGLGNGGLGRLAACFIDSLATLQIPAMGYGLRYEYGIFRQAIDNGFQVEYPDHWLAQPDPWSGPAAGNNPSAARLLFPSAKWRPSCRSWPPHPICSVCPTIAPWLVMAVGRSTPCGSGGRPHPSSSTSVSSARATLSEPLWTG